MSSSRELPLLFLLAALAGCGDGDGPSRRPPTAVITVVPTSGPAPLTVALSGEASSDTDGTIESYAWDFGDGASGGGVMAQHTYATVGEFSIRLTVTDDDGATGTATTTVVATGTLAVYNSSLFDDAAYQDEPASGTYDATPLQ